MTGARSLPLGLKIRENLPKAEVLNADEFWHSMACLNSKFNRICSRVGPAFEFFEIFSVS